MPENDFPIIGVDESGKGDFFGPLVIAGCLVEADQVASLQDLGVRDSKKIANKKLMMIAERIKAICTYDIVIINPEKYNELYNRIKNLNKLLGWGHARVIENILKERSANLAISDKFGADHFIRDNLQKQGREIKLLQLIRGEENLPVAAASILARAEFLIRIEKMSLDNGMAIPRGAGSPVDEAARQLVREKGEKVLEKVAKLHFKNYKKVSC